MARLARAAALVSALGLAWAEPAAALTYGGWNVRLSLDAWRDDNLARGLAVSTEVLPYGNEDLGGRLGLTIGNVFVLAPDLDLWVLTGVSGTRGLHYPGLGGLWGSLFADLVWHVAEGRDLFALAGTTRYMGTGTYHVAELGATQALWLGATVRAELGSGLFLGDSPETDFALPSAGVGLEQAFATGTSLGLRYALQAQATSAGAAPRHQLYGQLGQRLGGGWEVHARYLETIDSSPGAGYRGGYMDLGVGYDF